MNKFYLLCLALILFLLTITGCATTEQNSKTEDKQKTSSVEEVELTISAAASLQDSMNEIKTKFEKGHSNITLNYNFGASGALQQQISQGAPVDLFFSAAEDKFDKLVTKGLIEKNNGVDLIGNSLVLVVSNEGDKGIKSFMDLKKAEKLSIGTPEAVPAGKYAEETLKSLNIWSAIESKIVPAKDVRQVLTYVETGNVDAGIVYKTDALVSDKVEIVATADASTHGPIIYPVGVIKNSKHSEEALDFYEYLQTKEAINIFIKYGFKGLK